MNADRRKSLAKAVGLIEEAISLIEIAQQEEQDYYDNMPENMQGSERGERASEAADQLQTAADACDEVINALEEAIQ